MRSILLGLVLVGFAACGPKQASSIRTPDDYIEEQERLAAEEDAKRKARGDDRTYSDVETDSEEKRKWDQAQAELELKRATRSAVTCPDALPPEEAAVAPRGVAKASITFANNGRVKEATLQPPHADTPVGKCILRAMGAVIVPAFVGPEHTIEWEIDLAKKPAQ